MNFIQFLEATSQIRFSYEGDPNVQAFIRVFNTKNNEEIGRLEYSFDDASGELGMPPNHLVIRYIEIAKKYKRQGYGQKLLAEFKKWANKNHPKINMVESDPTWLGAYNTMVKAYGKPESIRDFDNDLEHEEALKFLPKRQPKIVNGKIMYDPDKFLYIQQSLRGRRR